VSFLGDYLIPLVDEGLANLGPSLWFPALASRWEGTGPAACRPGLPQVGETR
jgi:hypothetical protein